jgi:NAD(P)-dependent dehydrogenase (short-subunit alcohol dehydrogenase family)
VNVEGKSFVVTGGASGLGEATVRMLDRRGASVLIADVNPAGEQVEKELGEKVAFVRTDVTDEDDAVRAIAAAKDRFVALHSLVNCAGLRRPKRS